MRGILLKHTAIVFLLLTLGFCGKSDPSGFASGGWDAAIQEEFPQLKVASTGLSFHTMEVQTGVRYLLPGFTFLYDDLIQVPEMGYSLCNYLVKDCRRPETLLFHAFRMLGAPAGGYGPPLSEAGKKIQEMELKFIDNGEQSWEMLTPDFRAGIREYLGSWMEAERVMQQFTAPVVSGLNRGSKVHGDRYRELLMAPWENRQLTAFIPVDLIAEADLRKLSFASRLMASALSALTQLKVDPLPSGFKSFVMESEMGKIGIFGSGADTIDAAYGLIIDLGGDDLYLGTIASPSAVRGDISMVVDFAGNDTYQSNGASLVNACLGIGMLFDLSGDDHYLSDQAGIASSCYGTSMLCDWLGDDIYQSKAPFSQGAAHLGSALLLDLDGDDQYQCSGNSQGYGGTLGVGVLLDFAGHDRYHMDHGGSSFVQGAGQGRWAEATDGHSLGGGLGIFIEVGGSDRYQAESFSQGASYFTGTGLFFDLEGDDYYDALSHSQGYAAHYALAGFFESSGNDHYNAGSDFGQITQLLGGGRDLSAGWFIEEKGDDTYHFGNHSAGIGDLNGIGILWDRGGDDSYIWHRNEVNPESPSLGRTMTLNEGMAMGPRLSSSLLGKQLGLFRDNHQMNLIMKQNQ